MLSEQYKYWAFISYSHQDKTWGDWLHKTLETYRIPPKLVGKRVKGSAIPKRVFPIFRDREELPSSSNLSNNINEALKQSRYLIVICSPRSAISRWVNEEIKSFKQLGREDRILALIVDGEPNAIDKPNSGLLECFPLALRQPINDNEIVTSDHVEPIAADLRPDKDGKTNAKLKLLAGLLGIPFDELKQRERRRQLKRKVHLSAFLFISAIAISLTVLMERIMKRDELYVYESHTLAQQIEGVIERGNFTLGTQLALAGLPDNLQHPNRPFVTAVANVLESAYLNNRELLDLVGHGSAVDFAMFTPDGARVATFSNDGTYSIWDARTGMLLFTVGANLRANKSEMPGPFVSDKLAAFSRDGARLIAVSSDESAHIWNTHTGQQLAVLRGQTGNVNSVAFSPDGNRAATGSDDGTTVIWDTARGIPLVLLKGVNGTIESVEFSPDGSRVVTASDNMSARVWNSRNGRLMAKCVGHDSDVNVAAFSPDGSRIVTASDDETARIWNANTGAQIALLKMRKDNVIAKVTSASFSPNGKRVLTVSTDLDIRLWDAETGILLKTLEGHKDSINSAVFSPDGANVLTASNDGTARLWDAGNGTEHVVFVGHDDVVQSAMFSPDGTRIVTASNDGTARIWDARVGVPLTGLHGPLANAAFSHDGKQVITESIYGFAQIWNAHSGVQIAEIKNKDGDARVWFAPDYMHFLTVSPDGTTHLWDAHTGKSLAVLNIHAESASFSPDGHKLATTTTDGNVQLWDARVGALFSVLRGHAGEVESVNFSPNSRKVVTGLQDMTARLWDAANGSSIAILKGHTGIVDFAAFSPDGREIVTGSWDNTARLWDANDGSLLVALRGHKDKVTSAAFSSDGRELVTTSDDDTARIWDVQTGNLLSLLVGDTSPVESASFSPDGSFVLTASWDGSARIWDAQTGAPLMTLTSNKTRVLPNGYEGNSAVALLSPDGTHMLLDTDDDTAHILPVTPLPRCQALIDAARKSLPRQLTIAAQQQYLVSSDQSGFLNIFHQYFDWALPKSGDDCKQVP